MIKLFTCIEMVETGKQVDIMSLVLEDFIRSVCGSSKCKLSVRKLGLQMQSTKERLGFERQKEELLGYRWELTTETWLILSRKKKCEQNYKKKCFT